jgi:hypothetical protein
LRALLAQYLGLKGLGLRLRLAQIC